MRKEFKNEKAKHGLNKKNGIRAIGLSFLRNKKKNVKERGEGEKRKKRKRKRRRREEKEKGRAKGMELCTYLYG